MSIIMEQAFRVNGLNYIIRSATPEDAQELSDLRVQIDSETENLDREKGEGFIDRKGFEQIIQTDAETKNHLFLVSSVNDQLIGFSRCEGSPLKRFSHKVEFGVCVLKEFWGYGVGKNLLKESVKWADSSGIKKINLNVVETNEKAIHLYQRFGFEIEGQLKQDRLHSDGEFYDTIVMGRLKKIDLFLPNVK